VLDPDYPQNLLAAPDHPPLLYVAGTLEPGDTRAVAIIGTRRPSPQALARAHRAATALTDAGITIVSGLAAGIDTAAHTTTLDAGGRTIAVVATGLQHAYPSDNADLQAHIAKHGAVITQFPPDTQPTRRNFAIRNAITAGLALAVLLIEASPDSGSLITVRHALRYDRPVYLPGSLLEHDWARQLATKSGVRVIDDPHQIAADFPPPPTSPKKSPENQTGFLQAPKNAIYREFGSLTFGRPDRRSKSRKPQCSSGFSSAPERIRTFDLRFRRPKLWHRIGRLSAA